MKYSLLKDQLTKFTKVIEEEKADKEKLKSKSNEEIKNIEGKIKNMFIEEREYLKNYVENCFKNLEGQLQKVENNSKQENENLNNNLNTMKEYIEVSLLSVYSLN